tara:strand:+ start:1796 stop:2122 length:327 start_codon:yes stop_codon:yes gene_type:complete
MTSINRFLIGWQYQELLPVDEGGNLLPEKSDDYDGVVCKLADHESAIQQARIETVRRCKEKIGGLIDSTRGHTPDDPPAGLQEYCEGIVESVKELDRYIEQLTEISND